MSEAAPVHRPRMVDEKEQQKETLGWEQTKEAPAGDIPHAEEPTTRVDGEKPKVGSDERARLADNKRT